MSSFIKKKKKAKTTYTHQSYLRVFISELRLESHKHVCSPCHGCLRSTGLSIVSDSWWPHGLPSASLLCLWNSLGKNTGVLEWVLEWVAIPFSRGSSWPKDQTWISCTAVRFFTIWVTSACTSIKLGINYKGKIETIHTGEKP